MVPLCNLGHLFRCCAYVPHRKVEVSLPPWCFVDELRPNAISNLNRDPKRFVVILVWKSAWKALERIDSRCGRKASVGPAEQQRAARVSPSRDHFDVCDDLRLRLFADPSELPLGEVDTVVKRGVAECFELVLEILLFRDPLLAERAGKISEGEEPSVSWRSRLRRAFVPSFVELAALEMAF